MPTTKCEQIAHWARNASWKKIPQSAQDRIKLHLLDSLGCAIGALRAAPIESARHAHATAPAPGPCTQIAGAKTSPERAAFFNGALVRYLDFMDTYVAPGEACHPSDNLAVLMAGAELAGASGVEFLTALLVAYHAQCRITGSGAPILRAGFDHTIQLAIAHAAGLGFVLAMTQSQAAHAIAICVASGLGLAGPRAGNPVPQWKGLASAETAFSTLHNAMLAQCGVTGPLDILEGPLGLEHVLGRKLRIHWGREPYNAILSCNLKRYNAEFHAQTCIDGLLEMREKYSFDPGQITRIDIDIFKVAYEMIGGGSHVHPRSVCTKEDADHSLHYLAAVALLDGRVGPAQFQEGRIRARDVQDLLRKVHASTSFLATHAYPREMRCKIAIHLADGRHLEHAAKDYVGFYRRPMNGNDVILKFESLCRPFMSGARMDDIVACVFDLENRSLADLTEKLGSIDLHGGIQGVAA